METVEDHQDQLLVVENRYAKEQKSRIRDYPGVRLAS